MDLISLDMIYYVMGEKMDIFRKEKCIKNSDVLAMDLDKKQWKILTELDPPRARPLISVMDHIDPP